MHHYQQSKQKGVRSECWSLEKQIVIVSRFIGISIQTFYLQAEVDISKVVPRQERGPAAAEIQGRTQSCSWIRNKNSLCLTDRRLGRVRGAGCGAGWAAPSRRQIASDEIYTDTSHFVSPGPASGFPAPFYVSVPG